MADADHGIERFKAALQVELEQFKADLTSEQKLSEEREIRQREAWLHVLRRDLVGARAVIDFAMLAIRSLILVNGGAIVGIVTFTGNLWAKEVDVARAMARALTCSLTSFCAGLGFALATAMLAYIAQVMFTEMKTERAVVWGAFVRSAGVGTAFFSLLSVLSGAMLAMSAFESPPLGKSTVTTAITASATSVSIATAPAP